MTFARDLWEAMRDDAREQLQASVDDAVFDANIPPWDKLPADVRETKVTIAREELLKMLDRAGYLVVRKKEEHD